MLTQGRERAIAISDSVVTNKLDLIQVCSILEGYIGHRTYGELLKRYFQASSHCHVNCVWYNEDRRLSDRMVNRLLSLSIPHPWADRENIDFHWFRIQLGFAYLARQLALRQLSRSPYQVLHFHTQALAFLSLDLLRQYPSIVSLDMTAKQASRQKTASQWQWTYQPNVWREQQVYEAAAKIVTFSEIARQSVIQEYGISPEKVQTIYPGVDLHQIPPSDRDLDPAKPFTILFIGSDFPRKGGPDLLAVFLESFAHQNAELHLVTSAEINCDHPQVFVHSQIKPYTPEWLNLYHQADVFVLPTYSEPFGWVFIEALAAGVPIIATQISAIPEIVTPPETGFLMAPGDRTTLTQHLKTLQHNPELRQQMGRKGRQVAEQKFNAQVHFQTLETLFCDLAKS